MFKRTLFVIILSYLGACTHHSGAKGSKYTVQHSLQNSAEALCSIVRDHYVYYPKVEAYWAEACNKASLKMSKQSSTGLDRLDILELLVDDLFDPHANLNTNTVSSPRLIPSGADLWVEFGAERLIIKAIRPGSGAAKSGLALQDTIIAFNGVTASELPSLRMHAGRSFNSPERQTWAANAVLAGRYDEPRIITVSRGNEVFEFDLGDPIPPSPASTISYRVIDDAIGYIRIENSLGNLQTIDAVKRALVELESTQGLILDLRNTPSGGNTDVAEPILMKFFDRDVVYQVTARPGSEPEGRSLQRHDLAVYAKPLIVLVGRWTGSMGEGMAIGFDGTKRGIVLGSEMARLAGGTEGFELGNSGVYLFLPTYDLLHINGTPRHKWSPAAENYWPADYGNAPDLLLAEAIKRLNGMPLKGED